MAPALDDPSTGRQQGRRQRTPRAAWLRALAGLVVLHLLLVAPNQPAALTLEALRLVPLELPVLALVLVLLPGRWGLAAAGLAAALLTAATALKAADLIAYAGFGRAVNPVTDLALLGPAWDFTTDMLGPLGAGLAALAVLTGMLLVAGMAWWAARSLVRLPDAAGRRPAVAAAAILALGVTTAEGVQRLSGADTRTDAFTSSLIAWRIDNGLQTWRAFQSFQAKLRAGAGRDATNAHTLARLQGRDVLLVFVESYGRSALAQPRYARQLAPALDRLAAAAQARDYAVHSAWLEAPTVGGSSWLSHASLLSGLWIDSQARYDALTASNWPTLIDRFEAAGWQSLAVMPAITGPWPEGRAFGYDRLLDAEALDYAGPAFNWVTMPDQYTLAAMQRKALSDPGDRPVFAQVALISSHAPWTPIPEVVPWSRIEDGQLFARFVDGQDPPSVVWQDNEKVRRLYGQALAYSLDSVASFVRHRLAEGSVVLLLGDHQAAPLVTGPDAGRAVPTHLIVPQELRDGARALGWPAGVRPPDDAPSWRMDKLKGRLLDALSTGTETPVAAGRPERGSAGDGG
ncbi:sulfatase-like hydrolase/transferase [Rhodovibrio sodomensis]|uniref:sulfatase-like hydrolase/transferase n=1 Tax=Rhodovibrio sodomensis TaxID=1088 RepID=UPI0019085951|nr:sulfatase-like hydrolase/transferase [Rhodovibrio sodomensis]